jgi:replicative superfamily II helicase
MRICGLFLGINDYPAEGIDALQFAERDARELHAAFADLNDAHGGDPDDCRLVVGASATRSAVLDQLQALGDRTQAGTTELAIVHFSGHGSHDGRFLGVDADPAMLASTAIDVASVTSAMASIKARHVIVTLDSCFAGTVRGMQGSANAQAFDEALLALAGGTSRSVAWGAGPFEPARESAALRQGVFSSGLVRGLYGEAVRAGNRLTLPSWLDNAMQFTREYARTTGRPQTPGAHLHITGDAVIPAVLFGPRQRVLREQDEIRAISSDPETLAAAYPWADKPLIDALARRVGPTGTFNEMQVEAVSRAGVLAGRNVTVAAPTAAGKTVVGELAVLRAVRAKTRAVVVLPMRALVTEQWEAFRENYKSLDIEVIRSCGDIADDDAAFESKQFDVAFVTYEKLVGRLMASPTLLDGVGVVVLDEVQLVGDAARGRTVELLVSRVRRRASTAGKIQVVALCGEVGELNRLPEWLSSDLVVERVRPVPLFEGVIWPSGLARTLNPTTNSIDERQLPGFPVKTNDLNNFRNAERTRTRMVEAVAADAASMGQVLIFRTTRPDVLETAAALAQRRIFAPAEKALAKLSQLAERFEGSRVRELLASSLKGGVGIHLSDLGREERSVVEAAFRDGEIRVLCSTTTLAMGMNLPARTVVIGDQAFYNGDTKKLVAISVMDYRQMAGRAGRNLNAMSDGRSLIVAATDQDAARFLKTYVGAKGEGLTSGLAEMPVEDLVLALLALTGGAYGKDLDRAAFDTFWAYSERATLDCRNTERQRLQAAIDRVETAGFLSREADNQLRLTGVGRICAAEGIGFASAKRLLSIIDAMVAAGEAFDADTLLALVQATDELDGIRPPRVSTRASTIRSRGGEVFPTKPVLRQGLEGVLTNEELGDERVASRFIRYRVLRSWVDGHSVADIEARYSGTNDKGVLGFGPFSRAADRTADLLPPVTALIAARRPELKDSMAAITTTLKGRIRHGVTDAGEPLMRLGIGLQRSEAERLAKEGIVKPVDLATAVMADDKKLEAILGTNAVHALRAALTRKRKGAAKAASEFREPEPDLFAI